MLFVVDLWVKVTWVEAPPLALQGRPRPAESAPSSGSQVCPGLHHAGEERVLQGEGPVQTPSEPVPILARGARCVFFSSSPDLLPPAASLCQRRYSDRPARGGCVLLWSTTCPLVPVLRKLQTKVKVTQRILLTKQASKHASSLSGSLLLLHRQGAGSAGGEERTRAPLRLAITAVLSTEGSSSTLTRRRAASVLNTSADQAAARPALIMLSGGGKLERRSWKRSEEQMSSSRFFTRLPFARRNI